DGPNLRGIVGDVRFRQMQIAVNAFDLEPVFCNRLTMGAARDEENIVARRRKARTEIAAERSGGHGCNTHGFYPFRYWCGAVYRNPATLSWPLHGRSPRPARRQ